MPTPVESALQFLSRLTNWTQSEQDVREPLNRMFGDTDNGLWPRTPLHAPPFRADAVVPNPEVARLLRQLELLAPEIKGTVDRVDVGPTTSSMMHETPIDSYSTIDGIQKRKAIGLSPDLLEDPRRLLSVLTHEVGHARGMNESEARDTEMRGRRLYSTREARSQDPRR